MKNKPLLSDAIIKIRPNSAFILENEDLSRLEWKDNSISPPNVDEINFEYSKLLQEYESYDYWRNRKKEYPKIEDQLDILYHQGYDGWKKIIQEIKDKYPKNGDTK
jgi:hypothetical protein